MSYKNYDLLLKKLTKKLKEKNKNEHEVAFFDSDQEKEIDEFHEKHPHAIIFIGENDLEN